MLARIAIIAITTSNSIKVNAPFIFFMDFIGSSVDGSLAIPPSILHRLSMTTFDKPKASSVPHEKHAENIGDFNIERQKKREAHAFHGKILPQSVTGR